jgi:Zn finger protein HypA/HybF involved in hydrogenase expression
MKINPQIILDACNSSKSMAVAISKVPQINHNTFRKYAKSLGVYKPNAAGRGILKTKNFGAKKFSLEEILSGNHPQYPSSKLRVRLIDEKIKECRCEICMNTEWNGKPIPLQLDHVDGNHTNHKIQNLRILCPNCHAQTDTWCSKNKKLGC